MGQCNASPLPTRDNVTHDLTEVKTTNQGPKGEGGRLCFVHYALVAFTFLTNRNGLLAPGSDVVSLYRGLKVLPDNSKDLIDRVDSVSLLKIS